MLSVIKLIFIAKKNKTNEIIFFRIKFKAKF